MKNITKKTLKHFGFAPDRNEKEIYLKDYTFTIMEAIPVADGSFEVSLCGIFKMDGAITDVDALSILTNKLDDIKRMFRV